MRFIGQRYLDYAETAFYIIYVNFLVLLTGAPIITIGASMAAAYKAFNVIRENDNSMSVKDITICYIKTYIRKMPYGLLLSFWFVSIILMIYELPSLVNLSFAVLWVIYLLSLEMALFFQIAFNVYSEDDSINYFGLITKSFCIVHINLKAVILMVILQAALMGVVYMLPLTIIFNPGLYLYLNAGMFNKIKVRNKVSGILLKTAVKS